MVSSYKPLNTFMIIFLNAFPYRIVQNRSPTTLQSLTRAVHPSSRSCSVCLPPALLYALPLSPEQAAKEQQQLPSTHEWQKPASAAATWQSVLVPLFPHLLKPPWQLQVRCLVHQYTRDRSISHHPWLCILFNTI